MYCMFCGNKLARDGDFNRYICNANINHVFGAYLEDVGDSSLQGNPVLAPALIAISWEEQEPDWSNEVIRTTYEDLDQFLKRVASY